MKNKIYLFVLLPASIMSMCSCSASNNLSAPASLYEAPEGEEQAWESYNSALTLWNCPFGEEFVNTDYGRVHVLVSGNEDAPALILLPGLFGDAAMWYPNAGELATHYRVITPDMPNYGGRSLPGGRAIQDLNDYVIWFQQLMDHYHLDRVAVGGISYGSWLALALAREMPESIAALVLLDPSETFMPMDGGIAWRGFKAFMFFPSREKYADFFTWLGGGYMNSDMEIWFEHMLDVIEYSSVKMMDVPQHRIYAPEELTMVSMPVLIMAGGKPILYKDPEAFRLCAQRALPQAKVLIVPETGHGLNMEKADVVNAAIINFLGELRS